MKLMQKKLLFHRDETIKIYYGLQIHLVEIRNYSICGFGDVSLKS